MNRVPHRKTSALLLALAATLLCGKAVHAEDSCERIVSLAPSITETVYALGLGPHIVGVDRYSHFPPAVENTPRVGGFLDPNFEAILALKPTSVMYLHEFRERAEELKKVSLKTIELDQRTLAGIEQSILSIGAACGASAAASTLSESLERQLENTKRRTGGATKFRTLVLVGSADIGDLKGLYVSGRDGFYDELISAAGGRNLVEGKTSSAVSLSLEAIVRLDPEVIVEIHPDLQDIETGKRKAESAWQAFPWISAVKNHRIAVLSADYTYIPGPRFPLLLKDLATILHPEIP